MIDPSHDVTSEAQLDEIYGAVHEVSLLKEIDHVSDHYRTFIDASPFVLIATAGPEGLDCSPRGDPAGFVRGRIIVSGSPAVSAPGGARDM